MPSIESPGTAQVPVHTILSAQGALDIARQQFGNLSCPGILGRKISGPPVDLADIDRALQFLSQCRKTKVPTMHSHDLCRLLGGVQPGAVIAAAIALGFETRAWYGVKCFVPHALVNVSRRDVRRVALAESSRNVPPSGLCQSKRILF
jgi:hypothetical protein